MDPNTGGERAYRSVSGTSVKVLVDHFNALGEGETMDESAASPNNQISSDIAYSDYSTDIDDTLYAEDMLCRPMKDLSDRYPRISVTPSMFYVHARLRGKSSEHYDPMYKAIFAGKCRDLFQHSLRLPYITKKESMEELHKGALFFWDPLTEVPIPPKQRLRHRPLSYSSFLDFEEFTILHRPLIGRNHDKGDDVYNNFGYVKIGGRWVDFESEGELYDAYMGIAKEAETAPELPDIKRSQNSGPRVMSAEEQEEFYKEFVEDVTDDVDGEGDPRLLRISSATFARWAEGASMGDRYVERIMTPQLKRRHRIGTGKPRPRRSPKPQQFDMETGSIMSGAYTPESSPSVLESALGVDIAQTPDQFSYSCPQPLIKIQLDAYKLRKYDGVALADPLVESEASTPWSYKSERAYREFGSKEDPNIGKQAYLKAREKLFELREKSQQALDKNNFDFEMARRAIEERDFLKKEIFFLQKRIEQLEEQNLLPPPLVGTPSPPPPPTTPPPRTPHRKQHRRYLDEQIEFESALLNESMILDERVRKDLVDMQVKIEELRGVKNKCLKVMGERNIAMIPDLIPRRKSPRPPRF